MKNSSFPLLLIVQQTTNKVNRLFLTLNIDQMSKCNTSACKKVSNTLRSMARPSFHPFSHPHDEWIQPMKEVTELDSPLRKSKILLYWFQSFSTDSPWNTNISTTPLKKYILDLNQQTIDTSKFPSRLRSATKYSTTIYCKQNNNPSTTKIPASKIFSLNPQKERLSSLNPQGNNTSFNTPFTFLSISRADEFSNLHPIFSA